MSQTWNPPVEGTTTVSANVAQTWQQTMQLRWLREIDRSGYVPVLPRLQQAWFCQQTGEIRWEDLRIEEV